MAFSWLYSHYLDRPVYTSCCYFWMYLTRGCQEPFRYLDFVFKTVRFVTHALCIVRDPLIKVRSFWKSRWMRFLLPWGGNKTVFKTNILRISMNNWYPRYEFKMRRSVRINVTSRCVRVTIFAVKGECVWILALVIRHENRITLCRVILSPLACLALPYFSTL
jgi:hypothetical protein